MGESPLSWATLSGTRPRADEAGFDSLWLSDHLFLDIAKYGGSPEPAGAFEPIVTLGRARARGEAHPARHARVLRGAAAGDRCWPRRSPRSTASPAAGSTSASAPAGTSPSTPRSGWTSRRRASAWPGCARRSTSSPSCSGPTGGPCTFDGRFHRADGARNFPPAVQQPRPPVFIGGKGDRLLRLMVERADGWNTCWVWTPEEYRGRLEVLDAACDRVGRDPATVWCSLGLYALCGEDEADLDRRFERLRAEHAARGPRPDDPRGVARRPAGGHRRAGPGAGRHLGRSRGGDPDPRASGRFPFHVGAQDDIDLLAEALGVAGSRRISRLG